MTSFGYELSVCTNVARMSLFVLLSDDPSIQKENTECAHDSLIITVRKSILELGLDHRPRLSQGLQLG